MTLMFGEKVRISRQGVEKVKAREGNCENPSALMAKIKEEGGISGSQCFTMLAFFCFLLLSYQTSSPPHPHPAPLKSSSQPSQALPSRRPTPPGAFLPHLLLLPSPLLTRSLFTYKRDPVPLILLLSECHDFCQNCTSFDTFTYWIFRPRGCFIKKLPRERGRVRRDSLNTGFLQAKDLGFYFFPLSSVCFGLAKTLLGTLIILT